MRLHMRRTMGSTLLKRYEEVVWGEEGREEEEERRAKKRTSRDEEKDVLRLFC